MRFEDIKNKIVNDLDRQIPDVLDAVKDGSVEDLPELNDLTAAAKPVKRPAGRITRWALSAAACALMLVVGISFLFQPKDNTVACVNVDIGTSCQIYLDPQMNVTKVVSQSQSVELPQVSLSDALKLVTYESYIGNNSQCFESAVPAYFFAVTKGKYTPLVREQILIFCQERGVKESEICLISLSDTAVARAAELKVSPIRYELMRTLIEQRPNYSPRELIRLDSAQLYSLLLEENVQYALDRSSV